MSCYGIGSNDFNTPEAGYPKDMDASTAMTPMDGDGTMPKGAEAAAMETTPYMVEDKKYRDMKDTYDRDAKMVNDTMDAYEAGMKDMKKNVDNMPEDYKMDIKPDKGKISDAAGLMEKWASRDRKNMEDIMGKLEDVAENSKIRVAAHVSRIL